MTRGRKKTAASMIDNNLENLNKLDFFAAYASVSLSTRFDEPEHIAHASYAIAREMLKLSQLKGQELVIKEEVKIPPEYDPLLD